MHMLSRLSSACHNSLHLVARWKFDLVKPFRNIIHSYQRGIDISPSTNNTMAPYSDNISESQSDRSWIEIYPVQRASAGDVRCQQLAQLAAKYIQGKTPRLGQVEAMYQLMFGQHDVMLQAGTGYGKSMIWQLVGQLTTEILKKNSLTIMISPLNALTEQQVAVVNATEGLAGVAVTANNTSDSLLHRIAAGDFTHGMCIFG